MPPSRLLLGIPICIYGAEAIIASTLISWNGATRLPALLPEPTVAAGLALPITAARRQCCGAALKVANLSIGIAQNASSDDARFLDNVTVYGDGRDR